MEDGALQAQGSGIYRVHYGSSLQKKQEENKTSR